MIAFLEGTLISGGTEAVVSVGGSLGLDVQVSAICADRLPAPGQPIRLWTHLAVREDNWSLFGFIEPEERTMFRLLITVSGVGPKVALGILSKASPDDIAAYLRTGDEKALVRLPGIGKKSAARLIVELSKRVPESALAGGGVTITGGGSPTGRISEALAVLGAMGVAPAAAERALLKARQLNPEIDPAVKSDLEKWVRLALQNM